jgi:hypothetical protein
MERDFNAASYANPTGRLQGLHDRLLEIERDEVEDILRRHPDGS